MTVQIASVLEPEWTLDFVVDVKRGRCQVEDGGDVAFCATTNDDIVQAIVGILTHPAETSNWPVRIATVVTTQNEIIAMAMELGATEGWEIERKARGRWAKGDRGEETIAMVINRTFISKGWDGYFPVLDNELLEIKGLKKSELKEIVKLAMERP